MPINVLIVEDDPMVIEVNRSYVNAVQGFEVIGEARTAKEGLELISTLKPDLVLLDIYLPDMSGVEALQTMRKSSLPADVILVTAAQDTGTIQNALRYGAIDYIVKPFKFTRLKAALENYAALKKKLQNTKHLTQKEIDTAFIKRMAAHAGPGNEPGDKVEVQEQTRVDIPKGLSDITLRQVLLTLLKESCPLSAEEVAEKVGLARVTARRYLEYLHQLDKVKLELRYGSVGRPVKRYRAL